MDVTTIREDFPILQQKVNGQPLVYLDNAATAQKPRQVIDAISDYYKQINSNVHRGAHFLSSQATEAYEGGRETVRKFLNAADSSEINFTKGTTEGINLVAYAYGRSFLQPGDEVLITTMEHHSNIVPWQMVCEQTGAVLQVANVLENGELDMESFATLLSDKTKLVAVVHTSNSLGTINPVKDIVQKAHEVGAKVLIDAAQGVPHGGVDVQDLDCDFLAFSGHKLFGPTGTGVLYGKKEVLEAMTPYQGGGEMIKEVSFSGTTYNELPYKFEAGTPNIAGGIGLAAAIKYVEAVGFNQIRQQEADLLQYATDEMLKIEGLRIVGTAKNKASVVSFLLEDIHPYDVGVLLDKMGIAIRTGHHCCQPLMKHYGIEGTARASFAFYNTLEEVDRLTKGIRKAQSMLQ